MSNGTENYVTGTYSGSSTELPSGGNIGDILVKIGKQDGQAAWMSQEQYAEYMKTVNYYKKSTWKGNRLK